MDFSDLVVDFYNGVHFLQKLAAWAYVETNRQEILERIAAFEGAYEELIRHHQAGQLDAGAAEFSEENLDRVKRIRRLIDVGLAGDQAHAAPEVLALAERCVSGLKRSDGRESR